MVLVLDIAGKNFEPIDVRREFRRQRRVFGVAMRRHFAGRTCVVGACLALDSAFAKKPRALRQQHQVAVGPLDLVETCARHAKEIDADANEGLVHDVKPALRQQAMNVRDPPVGRILDRKHRQFGLTRLHCVNDILEGPAGQGFHFRPGFTAGLMGISARLSLKCDSPLHVQTPGCGNKAHRSCVLTLERHQWKRIDSGENQTRREKTCSTP